MKHCTNCGSPLSEDSVFCVECGTKYAEPATEVQPEAAAPILADPAEAPITEQSPALIEAEPKKSKKGLLLGLIGGGVGLLLLIVLVIWFFTRPAIGWRMSPEQVSAGLKKQFENTWMADSSGDSEYYSVHYTAYDDKLGEIKIYCYFIYDQLVSVQVSTNVSVDRLIAYCEKHLDKSFVWISDYNNYHLCVDGGTAAYVHESYEEDVTSYVYFTDLSSSGLYEQEHTKREYENAR